MDRRDFLKKAFYASMMSSTIPLISIGGMPINAYGRTSFLRAAAAAKQAFASTGRVLVLIQLKGGNDGLNTLVPFTNDIYYNKRQNLAIAENDVIKLNSTMGLGPDVAGLNPLWEQGKIAFIQEVGYENPNRSHFRSTDIWLTGSDSEEVLNTGWLGRYFDQVHPDYENNPPEDPAAIHIDPVLSLSLQAQDGGIGISMRDPDTFFDLVQSGNSFVDEDVPMTPGGYELQFVQRVNLDSIAYSARVKEAADLADNQIDYGNSSLGEQLSIVARLIAGGLDTPIYIVSQTGYDTHANQLGRHQTLLRELTDAIVNFQSDIEALGVDDRVIGATFSEFGRRVAANGSDGTDHGTSSMQMVFGKNINGGIFGDDPDLVNVDKSGDPLQNFDYRQMYTTFLKNWFGADESLMSSVFSQPFEPLSFLPDNITDVDDDGGVLPADFRLGQNYPNPFNPATKITFNVPSSLHVSLKVFDIRGREVKTLVNRRLARGEYTIDFYARGLASGTYFYRIAAGNIIKTKSMTLIK